MHGTTLRKLAIALALAGTVSACASADRQVAVDLPPRLESPVPAERLIEVGMGLLERDQHREAAQLFSQALEQDPGRPEAKLGLAEAYLAGGAAKPALAAFSALAAVEAVKGAAMQGQGISLLLLGQTDAACDLLTRVVEAEPPLWRAWNALGRCHDLKARWDDARHAYAMALKTRPDAYIVHNNLGMSLMAQGRHGEAEAKFLDALAIRQDFEISRNNLRFALALQGRYRDAFVGAARHDMPVVLNNVGYAALLRGESDRAQAYFARAMEASPHFFEVAYENLQRTKTPGERPE